MTPNIKLILITVFSFVTLGLTAQLSFVENKGQWPKQVEYKINSTLHQVYFEKGGFTFNLIDGEDLFGSSVHHGHQHIKQSKLDRIDAHAYKMQFVNANPAVQIISNRENPTYKNFFLGKDKSKWASDVKSYQEIYYKELYASIDLKIYEQDNGFKYDFIVKANADISDIEINYKGVNRFVLSGGDLKIVTSVGKVIEQKPYAYQIIEGETVEVEVEYVLSDNVLTFRVLEDYNEDYDLIIDPALVFSTYSGSSTDNWGFTACSDQLGNVYSGGIIFNTGYPATLGAYQYTFAGGEGNNATYLGSDITISKYTPDGSTLLWATYLGGTTSEEMPHSIVVNQLNELVIFGTTGSSDYPTTANAYDNTFNGGPSVIYDNVIKFTSGVDIIVSKLSADGTQLTGSTYMGGSGNDGLNFRSYYNTMHGNDSLYYNYADGARGEVIVDLKSDVFVGTSTFSTDFPTINGFQLNSNGQQEGIVFKLSADLSQLKWSSYLGGSGDDAIYSLEINSLGETYVAGGTVSTNFPTTAGAYQTTFQGGTADGFVAHINTIGTNLLASTYFGSGAYDQAYFVRRDKNSNVFITGQTKASGTTLISNAAYNNPNSGQFIAKFLPGLSNLDWSTTFGTGNGEPNISITAFAVDICNRVYLSGWGREFGGYGGFPAWGESFGTTVMEVTPDAQQSVTDGQDFYIMVMFGDASALDYATFYGEQHVTGMCGNDHVDGGTSRFDRMGNIYQSVCASCGTVGGDPNTTCNDFPTTTGVAFENNGGYPGTSWNCNNAVFRFSFAEDITVADFFAEPLVCENTAVHFENTGVGETYYWDFGDGSAIVNTESPDHLFPSSGTYDVTLWTHDLNTCNLSDTIVKTITVQEQTTQTLTNDTICLGNQIQIGMTPESNHTYTWTPTTDLSDPNISNPIASPSNSTNYILVDDDGICLDTVKQRVVVLDIQYQIEGIRDTIICEGQSVELTVIYGVEIETVHWSSSPNFTDVLNPLGTDNITVSPTSNQDYYVQTFDAVCQVQRQDTVTVLIDIPDIEITGPSILCFSDTIDLSVALLNGTVSSINWAPSSIIVSGQDELTVSVNPVTSSWLFVELENSRSCTANDSVYLTVNQVDLSYVKQDLLCNSVCDGEIELSFTGIEPFTFDWSNGAVGEHVFNLCAGEYAVTATDSLSCVDSLRIELTEPPVIEITITEVQNTQCGEYWNTGKITVFVLGGVPPYNYLWSNGDTTNIADSLFVDTYYLTLTDANNCIKVISQDITDPSPLVVELESTPIICFDDCNGTADIQIVVESVPEYTYIWNTGSTQDSIFDLCEGTYIVTVSDANDCKRVKSVPIINPQKVLVDVDVAHIACHDDLGTVTVIETGGVPPYSYLWSNGQTSQTVTDLSDGNYSVILSDIRGCSDTTEFEIISPELIVFDTLKTGVNCEIACNGTAMLEVEGGQEPYQYIWDNNPNQNENNTDSLCMGRHTVTLTDANNCVMKIDYTIGINPDGVPIEATSNPYHIFKGATSYLHATEVEGYSYEWIPDEAITNTHIYNPESRPYSDIIYQVNVVDSFGCKNSDTTIVIVKDVICDEPYIFVPNAFSPNNDGENDVLYVRGEMIDELQFSVYNRWGELVFNTTSINHGWDGVYQGEKVDPAVFVYHLKATCINKETFSKEGNITVVK